MSSKDDLIATFRNVYRHIKPGGVMICYAEVTKESFKQNSSRVSTAQSRLKPKNIDITFIENAYDPNPNDDNFESTHIYLIRKDGQLKIEQDKHILGVFPIDFWRSSLIEVGFNVSEANKSDMLVFTCLKEIK
jgi:hypothetical protein